VKAARVQQMPGSVPVTERQSVFTFRQRQAYDQPT